MKLRYLSLCVAILLAAIIVAGYGAYLKYGVLQPLLAMPGMEMYAEKTVFEFPFLVRSDEVLMFMMEQMLDVPPTDTDPPYTTTTRPTEPTDPPTHTTTDPMKPTGTIPTAPTTTQPTEPTKPTQPTIPDLPSGYPDFYFPEGVEEGWFDDVLFIGDSRTVGLKSYARSGNADYFCDVGMSVFNYRSKVLSDNNFSNQSLESLLSSKSYGKIFIHLGLNEIGYPHASLYSAYKMLVDMVRSKQPNAVIILQGIMSVSQSKANEASYFSPQSIQSLNNKIKSYANGNDILYIDCNEYMADENGYLYNTLTNDGCHPTGSGYRIWKNWLHWAVKQLSM